MTVRTNIKGWHSGPTNMNELPEYKKLSRVCYMRAQKTIYDQEHL